MGGVSYRKVIALELGIEPQAVHLEVFDGGEAMGVLAQFAFMRHAVVVRLQDGWERDAVTQIRALREQYPEGESRG